jgi:hypothetical protein
LLLEQALPLGDALGDVGRLRLDRGEHAARLVVEAHGRIGVADFLDHGTRELAEIDPALRGDLAGHHHEARLAERFARHAALRIAFQRCVEHGIADGVADLVRVAFGYRLGREEVACHVASCALSNSLAGRKRTAPPSAGSAGP